MRLTRTRAGLAAGLMALAGTTAAIAVAAGPASASPTPVVLVNPCTGHGQIGPGRYDIGCMPSQEFVTGMAWTSWRSVAFGGGTLKVNNCVPTCAAGHYVSYPILTVLWRTRPWPGHQGQAYFSRLTWIFTGSRPSAVHTSAQTFTLASS